MRSLFHGPALFSAPARDRSFLRILRLGCARVCRREVSCEDGERSTRTPRVARFERTLWNLLERWSSPNLRLENSRLVIRVENETRIERGYRLSTRASPFCARTARSPSRVARELRENSRSLLFRVQKRALWCVFSRSTRHFFSFALVSAAADASDAASEAETSVLLHERTIGWCNEPHCPYGAFQHALEIAHSRERAKVHSVSTPLLFRKNHASNSTSLYGRFWGAGRDG